MRFFTRVALATAVTATALVATTVPALASSPYKVSVTLDKSEISLGQSVTISGKVTGSSGLKGKSVTLYVKPTDSGSWKKIGTTKLSSSGKYAKSYKPTKGGPTSFRVTKSAGSGHGSGLVVSGSLDVFHWIGLYDFWDQNTGDYGQASTSSDGYRGAWIIKEGSSNAPFFDIADAQCTQFRTDVGVESPYSSSNTSGTLEFAYPGIPIPYFFASAGATGFHGSVKFSSHILSGYNLTAYADLDGTSTNSTDAMVLGYPEVFCNFAG